MKTYKKNTKQTSLKKILTKTLLTGILGFNSITGSYALNKSYFLGQGVDSMDSNRILQTCVVGEEIETTNNLTKISIHKVEDKMLQEFNQQISGDRSLNLTYKNFSLGFSKKTLSEIKSSLSKESQNYILSFEKSFFSKSFKNVSLNQNILKMLNKSTTSEEIKESSKRIRALCGDKYISQIQKTSKLFLVVSIKKTNANLIKVFDENTDMSLGLKELLAFSDSVTSNSNYRSSKDNKEFSLNLIAEGINVNLSSLNDRDLNDLIKDVTSIIDNHSAKDAKTIGVYSSDLADLSSDLRESFEQSLAKTNSLKVLGKLQSQLEGVIEDTKKSLSGSGDLESTTNYLKSLDLTLGLVNQTRKNCVVDERFCDQKNLEQLKEKTKKLIKQTPKGSFMRYHCDFTMNEDGSPKLKAINLVLGMKNAKYINHNENHRLNINVNGNKNSIHELNRISDLDSSKFLALLKTESGDNLFKPNYDAHESFKEMFNTKIEVLQNNKNVANDDRSLNPIIIENFDSECKIKDSRYFVEKMM